MTTTWKKASFMGVSALTLMALAACGNGGTDSSDSAASGGGSDSSVLNISVGADYVDYVNEVKDEFEKEHDVEVKVTEKDMFEQMDALPLDGPAGLGPDVTMSPFDRVGQGGSQGSLAEIELPDDGRYTDIDKRQVTLDDKVYGQAATAEALVLFYNKDLTSEAPETFADLEALSKDPKYDEGKYNLGFLAKWTDFYFTYGLISGYGGYIFGDEGTNSQDVGLNNKGAIEGITYATDWFQNVWPEGMLDVTANNDLITDYFTSNKTAAVISGPWDANAYKEAGINIGVTKIPTLKNGSEYASFGGGKAWVVSNFSKNKELAQEFVTFLTTEENQDKLYEMRSEVPANSKSQEKILNSDDEVSKAVIEQYKVSEPMPNIPEMAEVWAGAQNMLFDAGSGNMTPKDAADNAVKTIKESIEQKY
ncbi:sugar ABC transporter substrate-binding protein [Enterococcus casseliflavus]|jgi:arabinogalactan oligomer/maltooligosaccharide transport system substrate-binding protein|uniref:extracellular solute-binding protein n=1 Tax=Enterococcus casseliflavus TaxID=37734 RepID=UPI0009BDEB76|nr:extracellular solute-binding protein [Enterococcus casseliflavus]OQO83993.1 sugar ABC transporter substrate-binding protein [Enterococcus casseliflavus]